MAKMHETPHIPGTEPVTDNPNPGGTQGMDTTGPSTGPGGANPSPGPDVGGNVKTFRCADVGNADCRWETAGRTEEELRPDIERHAREAHGLKDMTEKAWTRIKDAIRERAA